MSQKLTMIEVQYVKYIRGETEDGRHEREDEAEV